MHVQRAFQPPAFFQPEIGIAQLIGLGALVLAIGEQLFSRRRAFGARAVQADADGIGERIGRADRPRKGAKAARRPHKALVPGNHARIDRGPFVTRAAFHLQPPEIELLLGEDAGLRGGAARDKSFLALHIEFAIEELHARCAAPVAAPRLKHFQPPLEPLVEERGADRAIAFQLEMAIGGIAGAEADLVDHRAMCVDLGAQIDAVLDDIEHGRFLLLPRLRRIAHRQAIAAGIMAVGQADHPRVRDKRGAARHIPGFAGCIGQGAANGGVGGEINRVGAGRLRQTRAGQCLGPTLGREREAADAHIVAGQIAAIDMQHEVACRLHIGGNREAALGRGRTEAGNGVDPRHAIFRQAARDTRVDDVDDAADRRRPEQQRGRPAQHFDALRQQRVNGHGMVNRGIRYVDRTDAIGQHADALALKAAQNRARGIGAE